jgi:regulator of cell morphogenesis and NO signaling
MKTITSETPVGEIVRAMPASARIFEKLHIDYCCGGKKPLAEVCNAKNLDAATVIAMLSALDAAPDGVRRDPDAMTLSELCDHIQETHHAYLQEELPRLDFLTRKVAAVHGAHEPRLLVLRQVFEDFNSEMTSHTEEENQSVFPAIRKLETGKHSTTASVRTICKKLEHEHDHAGAALELFNQLTDGYAAPDWACNTFRALYDSLAHLEEDMHEHVHKENNILFPKAIAAAA